MPKMYDMGYKPPEIKAEAPGSARRGISYPTLHLFEKVPPELMNKEIGSTCRIEIVGKITAKGIDEGEKRKRENLTLEIHQMGYIGKGGKATRDEYLNKNEKEREQYDKRDLNLED